jgi:hypothetical protein
MKELLTRNECTAMRGIAILAIMLHNYCHFIGKIVQENEYQFFTMNNDRLWQAMTHPDALLPVHLLSYFGHYGVPVFLFLSGYGLVMKYEKLHKGTGTLCTDDSAQGSCPLVQFVRYNYLKLLRMLIVGFSLFICVDIVTPGSFSFHWDNVLAQLLMFINVLPEPDKIIWPGIYWFFGLMMELYIVYRLLLYRRSSWFVVAMIVICWLLQVFCEPEGETLNRLRYNFIGGMLPFGLGLIVARISSLGIKCSLPGKKMFPAWEYFVWFLLAILSCVLVFAMCFNFQTWFWIPVFIIIGCVSMVKAMPEWLMKVFVWFGGISAAMFVAHPIARKLFITVAWKQDIYDGLMLYIIAVIALSWVVKQLIDRIPKPEL